MSDRYTKRRHYVSYRKDQSIVNLEVFPTAHPPYILYLFSLDNLVTHDINIESMRIVLYIS